MKNNKSRQYNPWMISALVISILWSVAVLWPKLTDWYRVPGDVRTFYWMAKFQDPALFTYDGFLNNNRLAQIDIWGYPFLLYPTSLGYSLLFYVASFFIEPILFGKLLFLFLVPFSVIFLFKLGKKITEDDKAAFILSLLFVYFNVPCSTAMSVASGLQRSFALPLLIVFIYYLYVNKHRLAALFIPIAALIYIPNALLMALTYLFYMIEFQKEDKLSFKTNREKLLSFMMAVFLTLPIAAWVLIKQFNLIDPVATSTLVRESHGLDFLFVGFPWLGRTSFFTKIGDALDFLTLLTLSIAIYFVCGKESLKRIPSVYWNLLLSGAVLYILSLGTILVFSSDVLYYPSRYSRVSLFLILLVFVSLNLEHFFNQIFEHFNKALKVFAGVGGGVSISLILLYNFLGETVTVLFIAVWIELLVFFLIGLSIMFLYTELAKQSKPALKRIASTTIVGVSMIVGVFHARITGFLTLNPTPDQRALYEYVSHLPKDAVLSGSPDELSDITLFSQREVFIKDLHPNKRDPIVEAMDAYYAETPAKIAEFCQQYGVAYIVRDDEDFSEAFLNQGEFFYDNDAIKEMISERTYFALQYIEAEFQSGPLSLIKCDPELLENQ